MPPSPDLSSSREKESEKDRLLTLAAQHVWTHGYQTISFRAMAEHIGTSHRMLSYYFGSSEAFWEALLSKLRSQQQARLLASSQMASGLPSLQDVWRLLTTDEQLSVFRITFQLYGKALAEPERYRSFLDEVVNSWVDRIAAGLVVDKGCTPDAARIEARLRLAVIRGLILDVLTTNDLPSATQALMQFAALIDPA